MRRLRYLTYAMVLVVMVLGIAWNFHETRQMLLSEARHHYFYLSQGAVSEYFSQTGDNPQKPISLESLYQVGFRHLGTPSLAAVILDSDAKIESLGVDDDDLTTLQTTRLVFSSKQLETDHYLFYRVMNSGTKVGLLGLDKRIILQPASDAARNSAVFMGIALALFVFAADMLAKMKLENPLKRFFREGLSKALHNVMQGVQESSSKEVPKMPFLTGDIQDSINHSLGMLKAWGQHKADIDQFIRAAIMESDKSGLAASPFSHSPAGNSAGRVFIL